MDLDHWQKTFLKGSSLGSLQTPLDSGVVRQALYPVAGSPSGNAQKEGDNDLQSGQNEIGSDEHRSQGCRDFFSAPSKDEVFLSVHSSEAPVWDHEFQKFPGACLEFTDPSQWKSKKESPVFSDSRWGGLLDKNPLFLRGSFWRNKETLAPWLSSLPSKFQELHLCWDPWSLGLHHGRMSRWSQGEFPIEVLAEATEDKATESNVFAFRFSSEIYHLAGATDVEELGILLSSCVETLRFFEGRRDTEDLLKTMSFEIPLGYDPFLSAGKVQGLYRCWQQLLYSLGLSFYRVPVFGLSSLAGFSRREPWTNLIRMTYSQTAGFLGGARGFRHRAFDVFSRKSFSEGRLSRNVELLLQLEAQLGRVKNPLHGSGAFQDIVEQTAQKAWLFFQDIEKKGGLVAALQAGWLQRQLGDSREKRKKQLNQGRSDLVGITRYNQWNGEADPIGLLSESEVYSLAEWWDAENPILSIAKEFKVEPLNMELEGTRFEKNMMMSDEFVKNHGHRPQVMVYAPDLSKVQGRIEELRAKVSGSGFDLVLSQTIEASKACVVIGLGLDPTDNIWGQRLQDFRNHGFSHCVWYGEKSHDLFEHNWSPKTSRDEISSFLFMALRGGSL